eukprot:jgi/Psemu1/31098/gm1.31098_g
MIDDMNYTKSPFTTKTEVISIIIPTLQLRVLQGCPTFRISSTQNTPAPSGLSIGLVACCLLRLLRLIYSRRRRSELPVTPHNFLRWIQYSFYVATPSDSRPIFTLMRIPIFHAYSTPPLSSTQPPSSPHPVSIPVLFAFR